MSERTTAKIIADLRDLCAGGWTINEDESARCREAAARLFKLDAILTAINTKLGEDYALRPPCPTCGGTMRVTFTAHTCTETPCTEGTCPDCVDGKVSIKQLVATYNAVHNSATWVHHSRDEVEIILRSVKP